ncbi:PREDICTED: uncharacterized protein LOC105956042 [Erythranthe guttata]|uniref:uncharacterized protein LOC105956042 n=1 Tax=Erythranthe guttata TaxID=4155 RepID=UPI00064D9789|nr:PREDICTED: uncharacterized protein LOC105956042 [Erythranthe guttata]|eukprot:XP_012835318.1 PREDICTED: uncharacterized protein LOC105956042 [Erythranthe guttata]
MSRREDRSSESKRRRSGFDRESSPKKSRGGKPETGPEKDRSERDFKQHRTLDSKVESGTVSKDSLSTKKYSQHDDRGSVGQNGRSFSRRTDNGELLAIVIALFIFLFFFVFVRRRFFETVPSFSIVDFLLLFDIRDGTKIFLLKQFRKYLLWGGNESLSRTDCLKYIYFFIFSQERGWWRDSKQEQNDRAINDREEIKANPKPLMRKRPSFREQKTPADAEKATNPNQDHPAESGRRRNERVYSSRHSDKPERSFAGERELNKAQRVSSRSNFSSGDRYREGGDRFTARQGYNRPSGARVEKWKHDLYHEANRSPTPKNEEDQISKIEALLGS